MSEHAMPLLIINMGGEMLYILEQRLQAQSIVEEKSLRVLQDVISTMFSEKFVSELFKPQKIYSNGNTRQIFDRLAHSSIMRLNQSSMDKLYDLMTMGFKYQLLLAPSPADLLTICLNHLDALKKLIHSPEIMKLLENATAALMDMFKDVKLGQFSLLRQTLARFFQDRRVKVSLFLQDQIQAIDGSIIIHHKGHLPKGADTPGTVKYYDENGKVIKEEIIKLPNAEGALPPNVSDNKNHRNTDLGTNLYAKDRRKNKGGAGGKNISGIKRGGAKSAGSGFEADEGGKATAKAELNLLASMIGGPKFSDKDHFNLNLFPDTSLADGGSDGMSSELIVFDADDLDARKGELEKKFGLNDSASAGGDDDLLDLMDSAEK